MKNIISGSLFLLDIAPDKPINGSSLAVAIALGTTLFMLAIGLILFFALEKKAAIFLRVGILLILPLIGAVFGLTIWQRSEQAYQKSLEKYQRDVQGQEEFHRRRNEERQRRQTEEDRLNNANQKVNANN